MTETTRILAITDVIVCSAFLGMCWRDWQQKRWARAAARQHVADLMASCDQDMRAALDALATALGHPERRIAEVSDEDGPLDAQRVRALADQITISRYEEELR